MTRFAVPARLARREVWRRPGRTALVALLVALPVAGMVLSIIVFRTEQRPFAATWRAEHGNADAVSFPQIGGDGHYEPRRLPAGATGVEVRTSHLRAKTRDGRRSDLELTDLSVGAPIAAGIAEVTSGRAPARPGEIALASRVARRLRVEIGDDLRLARPELDATVVGFVEMTDCLSCPVAVVDRRTPWPLPPVVTPARVLVDLPAGMTDAQAVAADPGLLTRRAAERGNYLSRNDGNGVQWIYVIGAVVLTVAGIVIAAAFAVGARRQLVMLGQLSANGAPPPALRLALVLQGTFTGLVGAFFGAGLGVVLLLTGRSFVEGMLDHRIGGYDVGVVEVAGAMLIGVAAATVAALVPARTAARVPTLHAMAGRRPLPPVPHRVTALGLVAVVVGLGLLALAVLGSTTGSDGEVWAFVAIVGGITELLGACALAPAFAALLEPLAARVRGAARIAARSLARQRTRTGAVISAVCAAGALAVFAAGLVRANEAANDRWHDFPELPAEVVLASRLELADPASIRPLPPEKPGVAGVKEALLVARKRTAPDATVARRLTSVLDGSRRIPVRVAGEGTELSLRSGPNEYAGIETAVVADTAVLDALEISGAARRVLAEDGIVVLGWAGDTDLLLAPGRAVRVRNAASTHGVGRVSNLLVTPARARELGLAVATGAHLYRAPQPLTADVRGELDDLQYDNGPKFAMLSTADIHGAPVPGPELDLVWHEPRSGPSPFQVELLLAGIALVFSVLVVGASLALAAAEMRDERDVLTIAGSPPRTLARTAGVKALLLSAIGGVMAVPIGFLPVIVFSIASDSSVPIRMPWPTVVLLVAAVPLVAFITARGASGAAQWLRPVRVSTATFE
jgi:putative ABC transport system permease protein